MKFKTVRRCVCDKKIIETNKNSIFLKKLPIHVLFSKNKKITAKNSLDQKIIFCKHCHHMYLKKQISADFLYNKKNYKLESSKIFSTIKATDHFYNFVKQEIGNKKYKTIIDIGANDTDLLRRFYNQFAELIAIDPVVKKDKKLKKIKCINKFFDRIGNQQIKNPDIILCSHTLEHVENPNRFIDKIASICGKKTKIFFQFPSADSLILNRSFDQIHHQHFNYFSLKSFSQILYKYNLNFIKHEFNNQHFGTLISLVRLKNYKKIKQNFSSNLSLKGFINSYNEFKHNLKIYENIINLNLRRKKFFYVIAAGSLLPILNYHLNGIFNKSKNILDDDKNKINKYFLNIDSKIKSMKNINFKNSVCFIGASHSNYTVRKLVKVLDDRNADLIMVPNLTI